MKSRFAGRPHPARVAVLTVLAVLLMATCAVPGNGPAEEPTDSQPPEVTEFALESADRTVDNVLLIRVEATDDTGVTGWFVGLSATPPDPADPSWLRDPPTTFALSPPYGATTVYAFAKDDAGNISPAATLDVDYREPGAQIWQAGPPKGTLAGKGCAFAVAALSGGAVVVAGVVPGVDGDSDAYLAGYDFSGEPIEAWSRALAGADRRATAVAAAGGGAVYVGGTVSAGTDAWVSKFDADGTEVDPGASASWTAAGWNKIVDRAGDDAVADLHVDGSGSLILAGSGTDLVESGSGLDWWLTTFGSDGRRNSDWAAQIFDAGAGPSDRDGAALALAPYDPPPVGGLLEIYFAGYGRNLAAVDSGDDLWVHRIDARGDGVTGWPRAYDLGDDEVAHAAVAGADGVLYLGGQSAGNWILRAYDDGGDPVPEFTHGGGPGVVSAPAIDEWGHLYVAGHAAGAADAGGGWIRKYTPAGDEVTSGWPKQFEPGSTVEDLVVLSGGYIVAVGSDRSGDWWVAQFLDDRPSD